MSCGGTHFGQHRTQIGVAQHFQPRRENFLRRQRIGEQSRTQLVRHAYRLRIALRLQREAAADKRDSGDLALAPALTVLARLAGWAWLLWLHLIGLIAWQLGPIPIEVSVLYRFALAAASAMDLATPRRMWTSSCVTCARLKSWLRRGMSFLGAAGSRKPMAVSACSQCASMPATCAAAHSVLAALFHLDNL